MGAIYRIKTAHTRESGLIKPVAGGGSWITNHPSHYYVGRAMKGSLFEVIDHPPGEGSKEGFHYGRTLGGSHICGWIMPGSLVLPAIRNNVPNSCTWKSRLIHRYRRSISHDFNHPPHKKGDGTPANDGTLVDVIKGCPIYYNYFLGNNLQGGHFRDLAGILPDPLTLNGNLLKLQVNYRYTTLDHHQGKTDGAVVIRVPSLNIGWCFAPYHCVDLTKINLNHNNDIPIRK